MNNSSSYQKNTTELAPDEIQELLEDYKEAHIMTIPLGTHVRYFQTINGVEKFRRGGILKYNTGLPKYVILDNGRSRWSVQIKKDTVFYRKMRLKEIKEEYEDRIDDLEQKLENLRDMIRQLKNENKELKNKNKELKKYIKARN